jgi:hypothetical protein
VEEAVRAAGALAEARREGRARACRRIVLPEEAERAPGEVVVGEDAGAGVLLGGADAVGVIGRVEEGGGVRVRGDGGFAEAVVGVPPEPELLQDAIVVPPVAGSKHAVGVAGEQRVGVRLPGGREGVHAPVHPEQPVGGVDTVVVGRAPLAAARSISVFVVNVVDVVRVGQAAGAQRRVRLADQLVQIVIEKGVRLAVLIDLAADVAGTVVVARVRVVVAVLVIELVQRRAAGLLDQDLAPDLPVIRRRGSMTLIAR